MQKSRTRGSRRASVVAAVMVVLGLSAMASGVASASVLPSHFATIKFWAASNEVTLEIPPLCPGARPSCVWTLMVDEPDVPAQTVVGVASGTSGILTVAYPADFCGVIQADAIVGPNPTRLVVGHQVAVTTASGCPPITKTTIPPPKPLPGTTGTTPPGGTVTATGTPSGPVTLTNDPSHAAAAEAAQLPFTGIDIKPMGYIGVAMVVTGFLLASTFEKRRRALRRMKARTGGAAQQASRVSRWFLGE